MHDFEPKRSSDKRRRLPVPAAGPQPVVQRKLRVGSVDDPAEREADIVADQVVAALTSTASAPHFPQRPAERIARSALSSSGEAAAVPDDTAARIHRMAGRGTALPQPIRRSMETAFGADFSQVRLHRDAESGQLNDELSARAFTTGSDVFLSRSIDLSSQDGTQLMAHELAHVVQQGAGTVRRSPDGSHPIRRQNGGAKQKGGAKRAGLKNITESGHYGSSRDKEHSEGKAALLAADSDGSISKKLYGRHNLKDTAIITTFPTTREGTFIVVGTFADVTTGRLTYDTAYLSKTPAATGVPGKKYYNPAAPIVPV